MRGILDKLYLAQKFGVRTAAFGQGIGPLADPCLLKRLRRVAPRLLAFGLRESRAGGRLLMQLGIPDRFFECTGDDAVEMAYENRRRELGTGLGVNLRRAAYSMVSENDSHVVRDAVLKIAAEVQASLVPVPIALESQVNDLDQFCGLFGHKADTIGLKTDEATPLDVVRLSGRCRVVITGSYHAAVFALSQGIPAVGLAKSRYYADKFLGLQDQFNKGCELVDMSAPDFGVDLHAKAVRLWHAADDLRPRILSAAESQIGQARRCHESLVAKVNDLRAGREDRTID